MEKGKENRIHKEIIDNFCVVDSWDEKQEEVSYNSRDGIPKNEELSKRKPTEDLTRNNTASYSCELSKRDNHSLHQRSSRSPLRNYQPSSDRFSPNSEKKRPSRNIGKNHPEIDMSRSERKDFRERDEFRRQRHSRSRSRDRSHNRSQSPGRPHRRSLSPRPRLRESLGRDDMDSRWPHYQSSAGYRDGLMVSNTPYANQMLSSNMGMQVPHQNRQYSSRSMPSENSFGQYSGFDQPQNSVFNSGFLPPISENFSQNQHSLNYQVYNAGIPLQTNPPNPVPFPTPWNQSSQGFLAPNIPTGPVMYPHLKVGHGRTESMCTKNLSTDDSLEHSRSSEKKNFSRSPESERRSKRHSSKKHSKSPLHQRYNSPLIHSGFESKKPKVIIDPNRIPTPPPPPIVGSYTDGDSKKTILSKAKTSDKKPAEHSLSDLLSKEKVSLSCLLEAVMENTGSFMPQQLVCQ